jgi:hypothetical protein
LKNNAGVAPAGERKERGGRENVYAAGLVFSGAGNLFLSSEERRCFQYFIPFNSTDYYHKRRHYIVSNTYKLGRDNRQKGEVIRMTQLSGGEEEEWDLPLSDKVESPSWMDRQYIIKGIMLANQKVRREDSER